MKKTLFVTLMSLLVLFAGCSVPPFNTKAKIEYDTTGLSESIKMGEKLNIKLVSKNGVGADLKKVSLSILATNKSTVVYSGDITSFDSTKITENDTTNLVIDLAGVGSQMKKGYYIRIDKVELTDENKNDISLGGLSKLVLILDNTSVGEEETNTAVEGLEVSLVTGTSPQSVYLKWTEHKAAQKGYKVYRAESADDINNEDETALVAVGAEVSTSMTEFTDKTVKNGYYYFYRVVAVTDSGEESLKQDIAKSVKVVASAGTVTNPTAVTNLKATYTKDGIVLAWDKNGAANLGYKVYKLEKSTSVVTESGVAVIPAGMTVTTSINEYTITPVNANKYYFFWVTAVVDSSTETPKQDKPVSVFTASAAVGADAVAGTTIKVVDGKVFLAWSANVAAEKGYKIYKMTSTDSIFNAANEQVILSTGASITTSVETYTDEKVDVNKYYFYRVTAVDNANVETPKQTKPVYIQVTGSTSTTVYSPVAGLKAEYGNNSIKISWTANTMAEKGYKVYRMESFDSVFDATKEVYLTPALPVSTSTLEYIDSKGLTSGAIYFYRVEAVDSNGGVTPKQQIPVYFKYTTASNTIPAVSGLAAEGDTDSVLLTWTELVVAGEEIIGYNVYASATINGTFQKYDNSSVPNIIKENKIRIPIGAKFGTFTLTGAPAYMKVAPVKANGQEGTLSTAVKSTMYDSTVPMIEAGTEIKIVPYGNTQTGTEPKLGAKLEWKNKSVAKYIVERSESMSGTYSPIVTVSENDATYDENISPLYTAIIDGSFMELKGKTAFYRIRCVTSTGAIGRPSGAVQVSDESNMWTPVITEKPQKLSISSAAIGVSTSEYTFAYLDTSDEDSTKWKYASISGLPLDWAGFKIYMANEYDGEYSYVGSVGELWDAKVTVSNSVIDPAKSIYIRVSMYDYFGNESPLSLRTADRNFWN